MVTRSGGSWLGPEGQGGLSTGCAVQHAEGSGRKVCLPGGGQVGHRLIPTEGELSLRKEEEARSRRLSKRQQI